MLNGAAKRSLLGFSLGVALCYFFVLVSPFTNQNAASQEPQPLPLPDQLVGGSLNYIVQKGDTLTGIGARFGVGVNVLAASNRMSVNSLLREGRTLLIDNRHIVPEVLPDGFVINIPQRMLFFFKQGQLARAYPVGLGRPDWPTPTGAFTVVIKEENPIWDVPESIQEEMRREGKIVEERVPPCPENPLGKHWLALSIAGYGIHGTIAPASIYQFQTHGCIRLHADDIAAIFDAVNVGTPGRIIYRRLMVARLRERIFLEVHRDIYRKEPDPLASLIAVAKTHNLESSLDWKLAKAIIAKQEGIARDVTRKEAYGNDHAPKQAQSQSPAER